ncbi:molybdopterin-binding protein [Deltaproteobacteria bacterium TL4]
MSLLNAINPAVVTVGDELILGELENNNLYWMFQLFQSQHCPADLAVTLPDKTTTIATWLRQLRDSGHFPIFVSGGIGGTHDDCTREGIAEALNVPLVQHDECFKVLEERYQGRFNTQRQRMAWLPEGCELIPNPYGAPGFHLNGIYGFPGFPKMLHAMAPPALTELLANSDLQQWLMEEIYLPLSEGQIAAEVEQFSKNWSSIRLGIYADSKSVKPHVTLRLRYPHTQTEVLEVFRQMVQEFKKLD